MDKVKRNALSEFDKLPYHHQLTNDGLKQLELAKNKISKSILYDKDVYKFIIELEKLLEWTACTILFTTITCGSTILTYEVFHEKSVLGFKTYEIVAVIGCTGYLIYSINFIKQIIQTDSEISREDSLKKAVIKSIRKLDKKFRESKEIPDDTPKPNCIDELDKKKSKRILIKGFRKK